MHLGFLIEDYHRQRLDKVKAKICTLYSGSSQAELYKSKIHGDVTYRNILQRDGKIYFIDFDVRDVVVKKNVTLRSKNMKVVESKNKIINLCCSMKNRWQ